MLRARVPEAPVDEHGHASAGEHHVRAAPAEAVDIDAVVDPEAQTTSVQLTAQLHLGARARSELAGHP